MTVADLLKVDSKETVAKLQNKGIDVVLLTGDNSKTAQAIAKQAGIKTVISEVLPDQNRKLSRICKAKANWLRWSVTGLTMRQP